VEVRGLLKLKMNIDAERLEGYVKG
jgi:hypothetical protein